MNTIKSVIAAGHLCLDIIPNLDGLPVGAFENLFKPGRVIQAGCAQFATGGPVSNTGLGLYRLGIPTRLIAKIGGDTIGQIIVSQIKNYSPELLEGIVIDPELSSSYSVVISPPGMDRIFFHCAGSNDEFTSDDIPYELLDEAALLHFGYPPIMKQMYKNTGKELIEMFKKMKATGITTSMDMAYPDPTSESGKADWRSILRETLPFVDIFSPSVEELLFFMDKKLFADFLKKGAVIDQVTLSLLGQLSSELIEFGAKIILIKLGDKGLYFRSTGESDLAQLGRAKPQQIELWADKEMWTPCFKVNVVGTCGAGDATVAGFLSGLLRDLHPEQALISAVAVGACNVEAADTLSGILPWEETQERIGQGWGRLPLSFDMAGWRCENKRGVWYKEFKNHN